MEAMTLAVCGDLSKAKPHLPIFLGQGKFHA